jgi:UDP-2-acetamido-3-amino-2,3-dideoxy-glucuronate N-acetyltransferase
MNPEDVRLVEILDARGRLVCGQYPGELPFQPRRFFVISDVPSGEHRGGHAHRACDQVLVLLRGNCTVRLWDESRQMRCVTLRSGGPGLRVPPGTFSKQVDFSADAILLVLASDLYDEVDYIRDEEFFAPETKQRADRM